jgi:hypothetical protein
MEGSVTNRIPEEFFSTDSKHMHDDHAYTFTFHISFLKQHDIIFSYITIVFYVIIT